MGERVTKGLQEGPRSQRVVGSVRQATLDELVRVGYGQLTIEGVAKAAGVHRTTIYRRWANKRDLLALLIEPGLVRLAEVPAGANLTEDLSALLLRLGEDVSAPEGRELSRLFTANDEELRALSVEARRRAQAPFRGALARAQARGELAEDADLEMMEHLAFYGMVHWASDHEGPPSEGDVQRLVRAVVGR